MATRYCSILAVREALGRSQSQLADMLGVSVRAVQSYEQGWRTCPPHLQKLLGVLMSLTKAHKGGKKPAPCWKVNKCSDESKEKCLTFELQAPQLCWLTSGLNCKGKKLKNWSEKLGSCMKCRVFKQMLSN